MSETIKFTVEDNLLTLTDDRISQNVESITKEARIFYAGIHKGRKYTEEDLQKILDSFNCSEQIPVQLDHSTSARDTIGVVEDLVKKGRELYARLRFSGKEVVEKIRLGLWKKVSVGLILRKPGMKLQEVSITPFPALKKACLFSEKENLSEGGEGVKEERDEEKSKIEVIRMDQIELMREEMEAMRAEKIELKKILRFKEDESVIETFVRSGKTTPAMKNLELELFNSLDGDQRVLFMEYKRMMPVMVDIDVINTGRARKPGEVSEKQAEKEARDILKFTSK